MEYKLYKVIKEKLNEEESVILCTNDKKLADETLDTCSKQSADDEFYKIVED